MIVTNIFLNIFFKATGNRRRHVKQNNQNKLFELFPFKGNVLCSRGTKMEPEPEPEPSSPLAVAGSKWSGSITPIFSGQQNHHTFGPFKSGGNGQLYRHWLIDVRNEWRRIDI